MAEMVERVARAILAAHDWTQNPVSNEHGEQVPPEITGWEALTPDWQECFREQARAAIEAMRSPTSHMKAQGSLSIPGVGGYDIAHDCYARMIDASPATNSAASCGKRSVRLKIVS